MVALVLLRTTRKTVAAILTDPDRWYGGTAEAIGADAYRDYQAAIHAPATDMAWSKFIEPA